MSYFIIASLARSAHVYVGAEISGYRSNLIMDAKVDYEGAGTASNTINLNDAGCSLGMLLGIKKDVKDGFIATEIFASKDNLLKARSQDKQFVASSPYPDLGTYRFKVDMLNTIGWGILGGVKLNYSLRPFIGLDVICTDWQLSTTNIETSEVAKQHKYLWGVSPGIGVEYAFNEKVSVRFSYKINIYEKFNAKESDFDEGFIKVNSHFKPFVHMLKIGLIYNF